MSIKARERLLNVLIVIGVVALLFVVGYPQYKESLPSKIKIGVDKSYGSLPFYVAKKDTSRRYFAIEKIEPELVEITGDPLQGIKDGLYDIVVVPWYSFLISPSYNGDTLKACGSIELKSGKVLDAIIIPEKSKIRRLKDIKGKRLGYLANDEYIVNLILTKLEEDEITDVERVPLQVEEITSAFVDKKVEALYLLDPYRGYMVYQNHKVLFQGLISYFVIPTMPYAAIVMRKSFLKDENRLAGIRIKNAVDATLSYMTKNPAIVKKVIIEINDWYDDGELSLNIRIPEYQRLSDINLKNIEIFQTELVRRGIGTCGIRPSEFLFDKTDFAR